ncbi:hypothetical protein [Priestia aryabhattai]|uniref:hypothetical protein n=1 Tax=Priestia aryabhattai TaxID=412384 RepID=UPI000BF0840B|nr:hypothetical protein [Priestia aryabhattai]PEI51129.1 hypothetical protein CN635_25255 [Priestia aryabhattai]
MIKFLLGVTDPESASKTVSQQDFLEFENSIYERMKDVQDIARNVQSDQISFLNTNITIFLTVAGLILAGVGIFASVVLSRIKTANIKAQQKMDEANTLMATARELNEQANDTIVELNRKHGELDAKLEVMELRHKDLGKILESKDLESKLQTLEKSANLTSALEKQIKAMFDLQHCSRVISETERLLRRLKRTYEDNKFAQNAIRDHLEQCYKVVQVESPPLQVEVSYMLNLPYRLKIDEIVKKANDLLQLSLSISQSSEELKEYLDSGNGDPQLSFDDLENKREGF